MVQGVKVQLVILAHMVLQYTIHFKNIDIVCKIDLKCTCKCIGANSDQYMRYSICVQHDLAEAVLYVMIHICMYNSIRICS